MMHNSIQGWQSAESSLVSGFGGGGKNPFFHFLFFPLTTDLRNWEERCSAFWRNRKLAEKMGLSKRCPLNINNVWGLDMVSICTQNLLLMRGEKHKGSGGGSRGWDSAGGQGWTLSPAHHPACAHPGLRAALLCPGMAGGESPCENPSNPISQPPIQGTDTTAWEMGTLCKPNRMLHLN